MNEHEHKKCPKYKECPSYNPKYKICTELGGIYGNKVARCQNIVYKREKK